MKIAHIAPPWLPIPPKNYGGTENVIFVLVEQQVEQGHDVTLFAPGDVRTSARHISFFPRSLIQEGVPWTMHCKAFYHLQKALEYIQRYNFDIVHTHLSSSADLYLFPLTASLRIPHVTTLHSRFPFDHASGWIGDADRYYMDWAPYVPMVAISKKARSLVDFPIHFVGMVYNGIDMRLFPPPRQQQEGFFVWLGRFTPEKGAHLAIEAAKQAHVPLVLAGTVDTYVQESVQYFHEVIEPQFNGDSIKYIGPVNAAQKHHLLSYARGFLNPIQWEEPFGMVMIEAMASYCPVISFDRGAANEIIIDKTTGYLVQDLDEMIHIIPQIDEIDRQITRDYVEQTFTAGHMEKNYMRIYKKVIAQTTRHKE